MSTTRAADITITPDSAWAAIHYTCAPTESTDITEWQTRWTTATECLNNNSLDDTPTPQMMKPARLSTQTHLNNTKHTFWHYPTTLYPEAVA